MLCSVAGVLQKSWRLPREADSPADPAIHETEVPAALVRILMRSLFREVRIELRDGDNKSKVGFPNSLALPATCATTEGASGRFESCCVFVSFNEPGEERPCGSISFAMAMEEPGEAVPRRQLLASVELVLTVRDNAVSYDAVKVSCTASPKSPERAAAAILESAFAQPRTRDAVAGVLQAAIRQMIGWDDKIVACRVTETALSVTRIRARTPKNSHSGEV